jgi:hypothetical protein
MTEQTQTPATAPQINSDGQTLPPEGTGHRPRRGPQGAWRGGCQVPGSCPGG